MIGVIHRGSSLIIQAGRVPGYNLEKLASIDSSACVDGRERLTRREDSPVIGVFMVSYKQWYGGTVFIFANASLLSVACELDGLSKSKS